MANEQQPTTTQQKPDLTAPVSGLLLRVEPLPAASDRGASTGALADNDGSDRGGGTGWLADNDGGDR